MQRRRLSSTQPHQKLSLQQWARFRVKVLPKFNSGSSPTSSLPSSIQSCQMLSLHQWSSPHGSASSKLNSILSKVVSSALSTDSLSMQGPSLREFQLYHLTHPCSKGLAWVNFNLITCCIYINWLTLNAMGLAQLNFSLITGFIIDNKLVPM